MLQNYSGILYMFLIAGGVAGLFILLSQTLGPKKPSAAKNMPFECGEKPLELPSGRHTVKFYLAGMLFVLFDIELIFFFPWAVVYRKIGLVGFVEMLIFIFILALGFAYAWRKGAFQWR